MAEKRSIEEDLEEDLYEEEVERQIKRLKRRKAAVDNIGNEAWIVKIRLGLS